MDNSYLFLIPLLPLLGAVINGALSMACSERAKGPSEGLVGSIAVLSVVLSFALVLFLSGVLNGLHPEQGEHLQQSLWAWFNGGNLQVDFGFLFDHLTSMMLLFITGIGALIHLYSIGYMKGDRGFARFMAYMNLFMFSMIMLVMGSNLLVTFLGWEGVGLCSYLLIGFWHQDHENNDAARKAFITNRVGDLGFLLGTFVLFYAMQLPSGGDYAFTFNGIAEWAQALAQGGPLPEDVATLIGVATFLIFFGCTAKSAQIPLLTWLPDAMAGPTPVSALIHAATMVTAGVFLVCRMSDLFVLADATMMLITIVGILTALYAAICALFQWDIKKVLAYSTISQLGFMFMAVGVGAFDVALFHVLTHAFFKATLFLGAGSVIHSLHHEQDMRRMGNLQDKMPFTRVSMMFAWWSICGLPLGAGFMSKDMILERLFYFGGHEFAQVMWFFAIVAAFLTAFYMTRLWVLTFYSNDRVDYRHVGTVTEAPFIMTAPVLFLGIGSFAAGLLWCDPVLIPMMVIGGEENMEQFGLMRTFMLYLEPALFDAPEVIVSAHDAGGLSGPAVYAPGDPLKHGLGMIMLMVISVLTAIGGCLLSWAQFRRGLDEKEREIKPIQGFARRWTFVFDMTYEMLICKPLMLLSGMLNTKVDQLIIQNVVKGIGVSVQYIGDGCRGLQRAYLRYSLAVSLCGVLLIFIYVVFGSY